MIIFRSTVKCFNLNVKSATRRLQVDSQLNELYNINRKLDLVIAKINSISD